MNPDLLLTLQLYANELAIAGLALLWLIVSVRERRAEYIAAAVELSRCDLIRKGWER